jgi:hypothetical protein
MSAYFYDRQESSNPDQGQLLSAPADFDAILARLGRRDPFFAELESDTGYTLLIGIGSLGCAQFSKTDGSGVPMMAVAPTASAHAEFVEFLTGGTATPVPARYCMPFQQVIDLAHHFILTGSRSPRVRWELL